MKANEFYKEIGTIEDDFIKEADTVIKSGFFQRNRKRFASVAASILLIAGAFLAYNHYNTVPLSDASQNVHVKHVFMVPNVNTAYSLISLSEEELFTKFNTAIFKGTITDISNIVIDFNGDKEYRAIAKVKVEKVYRGNCSVNDTVSILLPCPIQSHIQVSDTETVSAMREGISGIFMPVVYDDASYYEMNEAKLALTDIAEYGFPDGERYAFLDTEEGLIFASWAYPSIADASSLEEIEDYITSMLQ